MLELITKGLPPGRSPKPWPVAQNGGESQIPNSNKDGHELRRRTGPYPR